MQLVNIITGTENYFTEGGEAYFSEISHFKSVIKELIVYSLMNVELQDVVS